VGELAAWTFAGLLVLSGLSLRWAHQIRAFVWSGRLPGRRGALPEVEVSADAAPRGWKCAQVVLDPVTGDVGLAGVAIGGLYAADDHAVCAFNRHHEVPDLACECGFYAFIDRSEAVDLLACAVGFGRSVVVRTLCEVDLLGTVIECDHGFRASRQRVLSVGLLPWCAACAARGDLVHASYLGGRWMAHGDTYEEVRSYAQLAARRSIHTSVRARLERVPLRPLCDSCRLAIEPEGVALTLTEVANRLGTEVRWLDTALVPVDRVLTVHRPRPPWGL
jgi:hypothetical protein